MQAPARAADRAGRRLPRWLPGWLSRWPVAVAVLVVVLLALLTVVDRVSVGVADSVVAGRIQTAEQLRERPSVAIRGFPFLTQALAGRYDRVDVAARDVRRGDLHVSRVDVTLYDMHVPLGDALRGSVRSVAVGHADGTAVVTYADVDALLAPRGVTVSYAGQGRVRLRGVVHVAGLDLAAAGVARPSLVPGAVEITAESVEVGNGSVDAFVSRLVRDRFSVRIPTSGLPFGVRIEAIDVGPTGIVMRGHAGALTLGTA